jgi:hypothetical protein
MRLNATGSKLLYSSYFGANNIGPNIDARGIASDLQRNLAVSDNPYLNPAPFSFAAGASSGRFAVFAVTIAPSIAAEIYNLNDFTILGGLTNVDFSPVGSANFTVDVSPVPELGTLVLVTSGLLGLTIKHRIRKRQ